MGARGLGQRAGPSAFTHLLRDGASLSPFIFRFPCFPVCAFARSSPDRCCLGFPSAPRGTDLSKDEPHWTGRGRSSQAGAPLGSVAQTLCLHSSPGPRVRQGAGPVRAPRGRPKTEQPARDPARAPRCPGVGARSRRAVLAGRQGVPWLRGRRAQLRLGAARSRQQHLLGRRRAAGPAAGRHFCEVGWCF